MNRVPHRTMFGVLLLAIAIVPVLLNLVVIPGYTGDDAFIHLTYVRNLLERGTLSYNAPNPTYGSTSILWVVLCAGASLLSGSIPETARFLSGLLFVSSAMLFARYLMRVLQLDRPAVLCAYLMYLGNAVLFRWMLTGMETGLMMFITMLLLNYWDPAHPGRSAALTLAAYLTRPEFLLFPVIYVALILMRRWWRSKDALHYIETTAALFGCWFVFAEIYFGSVFPMSVLKSGSGADAASITRYVRILIGMYPDLLLIGVLLVIVGAFSRQRWAGMPAAEEMFLLFAGGVLLVYLVKGTSMISRYMLLVHPAVVIVIVRGLVARRPTFLLKLAPVLVIAVQGTLFWTVHVSPIRSFVDGFQSTYATVGRLLERTSDADTGSVMVSDVGMVGYYSRRSVVDLVGLTSRHVDEAGSRDDGVLIERFRPQYAVLKLDTVSLAGYTQRWRTQAKDLEGIRVVFEGHIGPLGVFSAPGQQFDVYAVELLYKGGGPDNFEDRPNR